VPLGSTGITRLRRYYGHSDSCRAGSAGCPRCFVSPFGPVRAEGQVSLGVAEPVPPSPGDAGQRPAGIPCSRREDSSHSVSNHLLHAVRIESGGSPNDPTPSGLHRSLAGSPRQPAESSLLALRTGTSVGVALHLPSRGRSYLHLPAIQFRPDRDFHPASSLRSKAHECGGSCHAQQRLATKSRHKGWPRGVAHLNAHSRGRLQEPPRPSGYRRASVRPTIASCVNSGAGRLRISCPSTSRTTHSALCASIPKYTQHPPYPSPTWISR
jgi:hypothetical protein